MITMHKLVNNLELYFIVYDSWDDDNLSLVDKGSNKLYLTFSLYCYSQILMNTAHNACDILLIMLKINSKILGN